MPSQHCISDVISAAKQIMGINTQHLETGLSHADERLSSDHGKDTPEHLNIFVCLLIVNAFQSNELFCLEAGTPRKAEVEEVHTSLPPSLGGVSSRQNSFSASTVVSQECILSCGKSQDKFSPL